MDRKGSSPGDPTSLKWNTPRRSPGASTGRTRVHARHFRQTEMRFRHDSIDDGMGRVDGLDDLSNGERLPENAVETTLHELSGLAVSDAAAHRDDSSDLKFFVATDHAAELTAVILGDAKLVEHDVRTEPFAFHTGREEAVAGMDVEIGLLSKYGSERVDDPFVLIADQNSRATTHQTVHRNVMLSHEGQQVANWDSTVLGARDAISLELSGVEPLAHGAACDVANLRHLAGGEDILVEKIELFVAHKCCVRSSLTRDRSRVLRGVAAQDIGPTTPRIQLVKQGSRANFEDQTHGTASIGPKADKQGIQRLCGPISWPEDRERDV